MNDVSYFDDPKFQTLFLVVLLARFITPLFIFRWPLPAIIASLVIDAVDQTVFQAFGYDPPFYQGYDKAMDVFYLAIAYVATLRNWTSISATITSRALFFYRQVGVVLFEVLHARALLLVFANTFEYFFIAYEGIRSRWNPKRLSAKGWVLVAAFIWIVIKLPQEYWIHVAQLDFTDAVSDHVWFGPLVVSGLVALALIIQFVVRPKLPPTDHGFMMRAPDLPEELSSTEQRTRWVAEHAKVWSWASLEKTVLIGLLAAIFAMILPGGVTGTKVFLWVAFFVILNAAFTIAIAKRGWSVDVIATSFILRVVVNIGILGLIDQFWYAPLLARRSMFFVFLFSVIITAYDRYRPVYDFRVQKHLDSSSKEAL